MTSTITTQIMAVFTDILAWFGEALSTVSSIFYADGGITFLGTVTVIGLGIGVVTMVIAMVRSLIKNRG